MRFVLLGSLATSLLAHDMYLMPEAFSVQPKAKLIVAIHNGDAFPESEVSTKPERLHDAQIILHGKRTPLAELKIDGSRTIATVDVPTDKGSAVIAIRTQPNFLSMEPEKFHAYLKEEGLSEIIDWRTQHDEATKPSRERYSKYAKSLVTIAKPDKNFRTVLNFPIEILPEANPSSLRAGSKLPVQVLFRGKPAANLQLEAAWAGAGQKETIIIGRTDAQGRITVPLTKAGKWRLHSLKMERCTEPAAADWESFWASLTFEVN